MVCVGEVTLNNPPPPPPPPPFVESQLHDPFAPNPIQKDLLLHFKLCEKINREDSKGIPRYAGDKQRGFQGMLEDKQRGFQGMLEDKQRGFQGMLEDKQRGFQGMLEINREDSKVCLR